MQMATNGTAAAPAAAAGNDPAIKGKWLEAFPIDNVAVHASLLPTGKILCWGRRTNPMSTIASTMDEHKTVPFLINMTGRPTCAYTRTRPTLPQAPQQEVNLFCSGHSFQPNGNLFIVGGHMKDGVGARQACIYNPFQDTWTALDLPNDGRWYPSTLTLPDGNVFTISGSHDEGFNVNNIPQISCPLPNARPKEAWVTVANPVSISPLYPRMHLAPDGRIFTAGPLAKSQYLDIDPATLVVPRPTGAAPIGVWAADGPGKQIPKRLAGERQYGSSVTYAPGKIIWTGGGNEPQLDQNGNVIIVDGQQTGPPTKAVEIIDLNDASAAGPQWKNTDPMIFPRRQHNATTLPDGTVLVTGGTRGGGFNNMQPGNPVHAAELWNPADGTWKLMAEEKSDRCYHCVALLLPSGEVLSAGSGEGGGTLEDPTKFCMTNAQVFQPPYLFKGPRPTMVTRPPAEVKYGQQFPVAVNDTDSVGRISWIRLGSVTHGMNMNQAVWFQRFAPPVSKGFTAKAPGSRNLAPPGHYMVFFVSAQGVPSVAQIVKILPDKTAEETTPARPVVATAAFAVRALAVTNTERDRQIIADEAKPAVAVGLTPVCPYGLGPCWAGAAEGLQSISDVAVVRPVPDQANSVAFVYLKEDGALPDIDAWRNEFAKTANGSYSK